MTNYTFVGDNDHGDDKPVEHNWKAIAEGMRAYCRALETQILDIKNGFEGCCHSCEPVGELNKKLQDDIEYLNKTISEVCEERDELFEKYNDLESLFLDIKSEISCRIDHGADSKGHLEAIQNLFLKNQQDGQKS
jgi:hypothetical protein